jgi:outer membrane receptor protein involved in Fe transport
MVKRLPVSVAAVALLFLLAVDANAATIRGVVTDTSGAPVAGTRVVLRDVATRQEIVVETGPDGAFEAQVPTTGTYLISVTREGFSEAAQTVVVDSAEQSVDVPLTLEVGSVSSAVVVTASRAEREARQIPLHVDTLTRTALEQTNQASTGDALTMAANITPVGNGPFGVRPRLRGLDSTRLLVLVDGQRLNTARQATERTGAEVGLVSPDAISRIEVVNGAGTLMYGSDALAGTINIITNDSSFTPVSQWVYGFNGFYSSNENGVRGTGTVGFTSPSFTLRVHAGAEDFEDYTAGDLDVEDTRPLFDSGVLYHGDTVDDAFGFNFNAFPEPFNTPYVRTDNEVVNSQARGNHFNASSLIKVGDRRSVRIRYQRRRMEDIGFPDFQVPYFFNETSLPFSNLDRVSARYEADAVARQPLGDRLLPAHRAAAAEPAAGAVSGADAHRVLPDQRVPPRRAVADRAAGLDAGRGSPGRHRPGHEPPADDGVYVLSGQQQRSSKHQHADVARGPGRAGRAWPSAGRPARAAAARPAGGGQPRPRAGRQPAGHRALRPG